VVTCLAFVTGLLFPLWGSSHFLEDDDPGCGPSGLVRHTSEQFVEVHQSPGVDHCVLCHTWRLLTNASMDGTGSFALPPLSQVPLPALDVSTPVRWSGTTRSSRAPPFPSDRA
jgi:hypothetical protein